MTDIRKETDSLGEDVVLFSARYKAAQSEMASMLVILI